MDNGCLYRGTCLYDSLPDYMKNLTFEKYKTTLKDYLAERELWDTGDYCITQYLKCVVPSVCPFVSYYYCVL